MLRLFFIMNLNARLVLLCVYLSLIVLFYGLSEHVVSGAPVSGQDMTKPTVRIIFRVRRRRSQNWDFWQLNSNICPPSLCKSSDGGSTRRPQGTGGSVFYNGDIVLDKEAEKYIYNVTERRRKKRATVRFRDRLWKDGILYYTFASSITREARKAIRQAMKHISDRTCITFEKKKSKTEDYVRFISEPGCWSNVGRVGGEQKLSIGRGCENMGTAVHEIAHTLGFWHEHSRPDRDQYVQVLYENVSPRYINDFEKINSSLAKSRGFPYDYGSIMHYKDRTFTNTGGKTLRVIGVGKELSVSIGQRSALSPLDTAQLRDMYFCNQRQDKEETVCQQGWVKFATSCYQFVRRPKSQFAAAQKFCAKTNSVLVRIDDKYEDNFLNKYINKTYPRIGAWRTGGHKVNGTWVWSTDNKGGMENITYTNWKNFSPSSYTSLLLFRNKTAKYLEWRGGWKGSFKQYPKYANSFICERPAKRKCIVGEFADGRDYRGILSHTRDGITCQNWTSQYPHKHSLLRPTVTRNNAEGLGPHNYCRNPSKERRNRPWCFTTKEKEAWQYCDVSVCSNSVKNKKVMTTAIPSTITYTPPPRQKPKPNSSTKTNRGHFDQRKTRNLDLSKSRRYRRKRLQTKDKNDAIFERNKNRRKHTNRRGKHRGMSKGRRKNQKHRTPSKVLRKANRRLESAKSTKRVR